MDQVFCRDRVSHKLMLGAADWRLPEWSERFYPEGMPPEWRLAYYNTQFSCLWLAHSAWSVLPVEMVAEWVDDTRPDFRFILQAGEGGQRHEAALLAAFASKLGLHCQATHPDLFWFDVRVDLRALADTIRMRIEQEGTTYLLSRDGDLATMDKVATLLELIGVGSGC